MTRIRSYRIVTAMALTLISAALTAGTALAERPDDRAGMLGVGAVSASMASQITLPDAFERAVARLSTATRPDDRAEPRGPGVYYFSIPHVPASTISAAGFEWADATAGAGAMLAATLVGAGIAVSIRHRGRAVLP